MTAVPGTYSSGVQLICDGCGEVATTDGGGLHDADVVYVAVTGIGWTGSAFARGPHRCPRCSIAVPAARRGTTRPAACAGPFGRVTMRTTATVAVVHIAGDIDAGLAGELGSVLQTAAASRPYVIADLTDAGTIDPLGLGTLVRARHAARRHHGELLLAAPSRFIQTVLRTMRLHTAFRTFATLGQAVTVVDSTADPGVDPHGVRPLNSRTEP
ncbi:STAS domain-containing protein [Actinoplanes sp. NPDC049668]|uniref:STAS domain-containing protein n=1 Tax=unclassified Actinoplanes TaxID=2626549 RepID=UPI0033A06E72